ncbi:hypothetical protein [Modestobacter caceresii]|uniref:hypothetical protein n=1 Tax=Modestobacter caceresii TaxID=1522368 RepID=UPI0012E08A57|nr:hypothetical protein [Modestobacter caceresii]
MSDSPDGYFGSSQDREPTMANIRSTGNKSATAKTGRIVSTHVTIPKTPSPSFVKTLRAVGAGEGAIRRATRSK